MTATGEKTRGSSRSRSKPVKPSEPAGLGLTAQWWAMISGEWPDRELIDHLEDSGKREAELEVLRGDLEALPPWLEVRTAASEHAIAMAKQCAAAEAWLEELYADEEALARLSDRQFCAVMEAREVLAEPVSETA